ncbi:HPr-rel-A system PqqD family peptide chaperone [Nostoc sp. CHAB 5844]|nr:HPr-rel-A system PqqD family peptide chaperone [Nostoc sp. CHAB 5844]
MTKGDQRNRYARVPLSTLRIVPLDAMTLIYHQASGQTHVVASPVPELIEVLDETPCDVATLLARLGEQFDLGDPDAAALAARLDELADVGLVVRA